VPSTSPPANKALAPERTSTPASTGAQQALATPEKAPSEKTASGPCRSRARRPGIGKRSLPPANHEHAEREHQRGAAR
jgi:hypothetical protein